MSDYISLYGESGGCATNNAFRLHFWHFQLLTASSCGLTGLMLVYKGSLLHVLTLNPDSLFVLLHMEALSFIFFLVALAYQIVMFILIYVLMNDLISSHDQQ